MGQTSQQLEGQIEIYKYMPQVDWRRPARHCAAFNCSFQHLDQR